MLTIIAICAFCFICFIIGLSCSYRQGQEQGYLKGYKEGQLYGFDRGVVHARKEIHWLVCSDNCSDYKGPISQPPEYTIETVEF